MKLYSIMLHRNDGMLLWEELFPTLIEAITFAENDYRAMVDELFETATVDEVPLHWEMGSTETSRGRTHDAWGWEATADFAAVGWNDEASEANTMGGIDGKFAYVIATMKLGEG